MKTFIQRKTLQESLGSPSASSTPINRPGLPSSSQEVATPVTPEIVDQNETKLDNPILEQQATEKSESEEEANSASEETNEKEHGNEAIENTDDRVF